MNDFAALKKDVFEQNAPKRSCSDYYAARALRTHLNDPVVIARGYAAAAQFRDHRKYVYRDDLILGSSRGKIAPENVSDEQLQKAEQLVRSYGYNSFWTNSDHFAPDYPGFLSLGVGGMLSKIRASRAAHRLDADFEKKKNFLEAAEIAMLGFRDMILGYAAEAERMGGEELLKAAAVCRKLADHAPETFREALQLVWLCHVAFLYEKRYAMALGRLDQHLWPFYERDLAAGRITYAEAVELLKATFIKIGESWLLGGDDVVNIAIGGVKRDGTTAVNELSYAMLEAVRECNIPGPNLSARLHEGIEERFIDACLQVIGTGLGYPALMNDEINIPALHRHGYTLEDSRDYCMVGCIENFITGKQPPWSDGRYNVPLYLEAVLTRGYSLLDGTEIGIDTGAPEQMDTMDKFVAAFEAQLQYAADEYARVFKNENERYNREHYSQPFLSCFCEDCIARGLDINDGGAVYPSVHGAACMGIATVADSLAAIQRLVYDEKVLTLGELKTVLEADFAGYEELRKKMLACPKYGNDDDYVDRWAIWYVEVCDRVFAKHRTWDDGAFYTGIASNTSNIPAGLEVAATPDGRKAREPMSDAASPMHGMDHNGPTAVVNSCTKPDFRLVSCGTVLNQKYTPEMFRDPALRAKLSALVRTYFAKGGQEMQINAVSREILQDAMAHPEQYGSLVVRVSGFSAFYTRLSREVQEDILKRTEHDG